MQYGRRRLPRIQHQQALRESRKTRSRCPHSRRCTRHDPVAGCEPQTIQAGRHDSLFSVHSSWPSMPAKALSGGPKSSITFTTGAVSEKPIPNWAMINSYATGLQGMTRGLALDMKPIRVNLVSPGAVDTELWGTWASLMSRRRASWIRRRRS